MKLPWDKKYLYWGVTGFLTIAASILFFMLLQYGNVVGEVFSLIAKSLRPITYGLIFAYLLNPLLNVIEHSFIQPLLKKLIRKNEKAVYKLSRGISICLTWFVTITILFALMALVIPEIYSSIEALIMSLPAYANNLLLWGERVLRENPDILKFLQEFISGFTTDVTLIANRIKELIPNINIVITGLTTGIYGAVAIILNVVIGVIVSVYVLKDKEKFVAQIKRILYSSMTIKKANRIVAVSRLTHDKFGNFITGKIFDSLIIGMLCFVILALFNIPYSVLVSVIVGITNVIPFFGPFIGAIPSAFLILLADPVKCITFVVIIIILQQFDGNILGPKILGNTTGISSFWVLFSILVGSGLFGAWGMVCAVPVFAVIYSIAHEMCHISLRRKGIDYSTETYKKLGYIDETTGAPEGFCKD